MHISRREFIVVSATGTVTLASTACGGSNRTPRSEATTRLSVVVSGLVGMVSPNEATHLILLDGEKTGIGKHSARLSVAAGNVAGEGAKMALLSIRERAGALALLEEVTYVELSDRPDFNDRFVDLLAFPG